MTVQQLNWVISGLYVLVPVNSDRQILISSSQRVFVYRNSFKGFL